ncbi:MAG: hypoxanthine phosphoribosyltransferase [Phycisphaerae bacterium]|nr:hypoxanthine phosphoribosyltransferase [Phycisphaerae bacterium]
MKIKDSPLDGPLCRYHEVCDDIQEVVITADQIQKTVEILSHQIHEVYANDTRVVIPVLLQGARHFADDLSDRLNDSKFQFVPVKVSSYRGGTRSTGQVVIHSTETLDIRGQAVLIVDDIYDSGRTLTQVKAHLEAQNPAHVKTCVMFEKACEHIHDVPLDFVGLPVPDDFVVGYGLDYQDRYRELHCVGTLKPDVIATEDRYEDAQSIG